MKMAKNRLDLKLLEKLSNSFGPSGFEEEVQILIREYGKKYADEILYDKTGSIIFKYGSTGPRVMIAGHADEIGFIISQIEESGFIRIQNLGGWWDQVLLGHQVLIKPLSGTKPVIGIIGAQPPHLLTPEAANKLVTLNQVFVDIGCRSAEDVRDLGLEIGDPIVPYSQFRIEERVWKINDKKRKVQIAIGKAFDDRIGNFVLLELLRRLKEDGITLPNTLYLTCTTQEEVGCRGARTAANVIKPDIGIVVEADICRDIPGITENPINLGEGVSILAYDQSMIPNPKFRQFVVNSAKENNIKHQLSFLKRGGTDGGPMHLNADGVPTIGTGVPTRHIHSPYGILALDDVEGAVQLLLSVVQSLTSETITGFTQF